MLPSARLDELLLAEQGQLPLPCCEVPAMTQSQNVRHVRYDAITDRRYVARMPLHTQRIVFSLWFCVMTGVLVLLYRKLRDRLSSYWFIIGRVLLECRPGASSSITSAASATTLSGFDENASHHSEPREALASSQPGIQGQSFEHVLESTAPLTFGTKMNFLPFSSPFVRHSKKKPVTRPFVGRIR